ncbi:transmembrane protein [Ceratobasidium sp. AG-Ba]|nr:transmembrane protein [Ceratobasidium sp. AG-Ba]QRW10501.1 transmembrane protein [Ceratobasidium sp. AG-Ba]QRW14397.1 transmembrane protein [Ceratobasidium sp. AG-Ba]
MSTNSSSTPVTPAALGTPSTPRFRPLWTVNSRFQKKTLTGFAISPGGIWAASASLDSNIVFLDFRTGQLVGVFSFDGRFYATTLRWDSESVLYAGCSDGRLLVVDFSPASNPPVSIRPVPLKLFGAAVTALALDPLRNMLAVGYAGKTSIISRPPSGHDGLWKILDTIPEPCEGPHGTVTTIGFVGESFTNRRLIIGHAKAGFCTWTAPGEYHSTPYDPQGLVCSIGSATFSIDGRFIAIATLDHSLVIYPMSQKGGPVVHQRQALPNYEHATHRPIIPIALAANNLVLRGSTTGKVSIIDLQSGPLAPLEHGPEEMVRSLTTYNDRVVVGLSDATGEVSKIKCYLDRTSPLPNYVRLQKTSEDPLFEIGIGDLEKKNSLVARIARSKFADFVRSCYAKSSKRIAHWSTLVYSRDTWIVLGVLWMFLVMLVVDPPSIPGPKLFGSRRNETFGSDYSSDEDAEPIFIGGVLFCISRLAIPLVGRFSGFICYAIGTVIRVVRWLPLAIQFFMTDIPAFLSAVICDALPDINICPERV